MFNLDHWKNPRNTIASVYQDNDMAYVTHGIKSAADIIKVIDEKPSILLNKNILEYGCGTGKNLRALHYFFKDSVGWDPVDECILEANREYEFINKKVDGFPKKRELLNSAQLKFTSELTDILNLKFDYIVAIDVIEHLTYSDAKIAIDNMISMLSETGSIVFNTSAAKNRQILDEYKSLHKSLIEYKSNYLIIKAITNEN